MHVKWQRRDGGGLGPSLDSARPASSISANVLNGACRRHIAEIIRGHRRHGGDED